MGLALIEPIHAHLELDWASLASSAVQTLPSPESRRVYESRIREFLHSRRKLNREQVGSYIARLRDAGAGVSVINQTLAAIRKLASEAEVRGLISEPDARAIQMLKGHAVRGVRFGNWLTLEGVRRLLALPDRGTLAGARDAALLSLLVGCGLRRAEAANLNWSNYQSRDGRMMLVDITGKGNKTRTVPVAEWVQADLDLWHEAYSSALVRCHGQEGPHGRVLIGLGGAGLGQTVETNKFGASLSTSGIWWIVKRYAKQLGMDNIAPHDLRRTLAQLMRQAGAEIEQIQFTLGHESVRTTEKYLGGRLEVGKGKAAVDKIEI